MSLTKVRDVATSPVYCIRETDGANHARQEMLRRGVTKLPVLDEDDKLVGILTVKDLVKDLERVSADASVRLHIHEGQVSGLMTRNPFSVRPQMDAGGVIHDLVRHGIVAAPVVDEGSVVGIVTAHDLMPVIEDALEGEAVVRDVMSPDVVRLHRHDSISHAVQAILKNDASGAIVTEAESDVTRVGVVTLESILLDFVLEPRSPREKEIQSTRKLGYGSRKSARKVDYNAAVVEDAMWQDHPTVRPDAGISAATNVIVHEEVDVLPVVDDGAVVGIIGKREILRLARERVRAQA